jgi:hypothetical protein
MATSGTTAWSLNVATIVETAARRAFPADKKGSLAAVDAVNARNCMNMVLVDITNEGYALSKLEYKTFDLTQGTTSYSLSQDVLDVFDVVYAKYQGSGSDPEFNETALTRIDLAAYNEINNKGIESYVSQFALHRGLNGVTMYIYPTATSDDDEMRYWALTRTEDVNAAFQDVDLNYRYTNVLTAGLAYYMAMEKPEDSEMYELRLKRLETTYFNSLASAFSEDRDRSSLFAYPSFQKK